MSDRRGKTFQVSMDSTGQCYFDFPDQSISVSNTTRRCCRCRLQKTLDAFPRNRSKSGGFSSMCKPCHRKRMRERLSEPREWVYQICRVIKARARRKGLDYDLDQQGLFRRMAGNCYRCEVTGIPFNFTQGEGQRFDSPSVDRIDNSLGYTMQNVQFVCWEYNRLKGELPESDFVVAQIVAIVQRVATQKAMVGGAVK